MWVCAGLFLTGDISYLSQVHSLALSVAFCYVSRSQVNIKLWKKVVNVPKTAVSKKVKNTSYSFNQSSDQI